MNITEARIIKLISQVPKLDRNVYYISAKLNKSYSSIYNYLRILGVDDHVKKIKTASNKTFFQTNNESIDIATGVLSNVSSD